MTRVHPILLPGPVVGSEQIDLANDFAWMHRSVCTGPGGDRYVLSDLTYNYYRYNKAEIDRGMVAGHVVTRYAPDGGPVAQVFMQWARSGAGAGYPRVSLSVLPDGRVLFGKLDNRALVIDPALGSCAEVAAPGGVGWPFRTRLTPSGRVLCLLGENVVAISREPVGADLPALTAVTAAQFEPHLYREPAYCPPAGTLGEGEPRTELVAEIKADHEKRVAIDPRRRRPDVRWLYDAVPIDDSTFVALAIGWQKRAYQRGSHFLFALMNTDGELLGELDLQTYRDSAARGIRYDVVVDQARRRIFHLNTFGLYVFDDSGTRTAHLSTEDKEYKPLAHFQLREFDPAGQLLLVHEKQNLLLSVPVSDDLADLPEAVTDSLALFRKERTRLKKEHQPEKWHWITTDTPVLWL